MPADPSIESQITRLNVLMEQWEGEMKGLRETIKDGSQKVDRMSRQVERLATGYQQLREKVEAGEKEIQRLTKAFSPIDESYKQALARGARHVQLVTNVQVGIAVLIVSFFLMGIVQPIITHGLFHFK